MVAYSFQRRFEAPIVAGTKRQTIRAVGLRRHARPGDEVQLYRGMRSKSCTLIARARCRDLHEIVLDLPNRRIVVGDVTMTIPAELVGAGHRRRSLGGISGRAQFLGLTSVRADKRWSAEQDEVLRAAYEQGLPIPEVRLALARAGFRRSRGAIQMRAIHLQLTSDRVKYWTEPELAIVKSGLIAGKAFRVVLDELREAGFERGVTSLRKLAQKLNLARVRDPWTDRQTALLKELYAKRRPVMEIAAAVGKSRSAVASYASSIGLRQRDPWTEAERDELVRASEVGERLTEVAERIGRPYPNVQAEAGRMGLDFRRRRPVAIAAE